MNDARAGAKEIVRMHARESVQLQFALFVLCEDNALEEISEESASCASLQTNISAFSNSSIKPVGSGTNSSYSPESSDKEEIQRFLAKCQKIAQQTFLFDAMIFPPSVYPLVLQGGKAHVLQCFESNQTTNLNLRDCHFVIFGGVGRGPPPPYPSLVSTRPTLKKKGGDVHFFFYATCIKKKVDATYSTK